MADKSAHTIGEQDYLERTRAFWQPHADRALSHEDAREMAGNLVGFFRLLREWKIEENRTAADRKEKYARGKSSDHQRHFDTC